MNVPPLSTTYPFRLTIVVLLLALVHLIIGGAGSPTANAAQASFADKSFQQVWERTDAHVLSGQVQRSWYWGPQPGTTHSEPYSGGKSGTRLVQYFDKARMEINNPEGDRASEWFVTTGLLVVEMVSGKQQVGDKEFVPRGAAEIAVGGDGLGTDPDAPTYTSFRPVASLTGPGANRAPKLTGQAVTATLDRAGQVGSNQALGLYTGARLAAYSDVLGHNIPQAMWDFLNLKGVIQQNGARVNGQTIANWVFVMGYPITEPYWTRVKIDGVYHDALFQMYERRSLAYVPSMPAGWQVQMGNVGQHYYRWIYGGPLPTPRVPLGTPVVVPPPVNATIDMTSVPVGQPLTISVTGFQPGEGLVSWYTKPDKSITDAGINLVAGTDGTVRDIVVPTSGLYPGLWSITFYGTASNRTAVAYFSLYYAPPSAQATATLVGQPPTSTITPTRTRTPTPARTSTSLPGGATPSATVPNVPTQPPGGLVLSVRPGYGPPNSQFTFSASGLSGGERVQVKFTDPNGNVVFPAGSNGGLYNAGSDGRLVITLIPTEAFPSVPPGVWLYEVQGEVSRLEGVVGFNIRP